MEAPPVAPAAAPPAYGALPQLYTYRRFRLWWWWGVHQQLVATGGPHLRRATADAAAIRWAIGRVS